MAQDKFKNENKVRKIGGRLADDYYHFKREIEYINDYFFELFSILGLTDDLDTIIEALNDSLIYLKKVFINKTMRDIERGKIPRYRFLSQRLKKKLPSLTPDDEEKVWRRETHRSLTGIYKKIYEQYLKENKLYGLETRHPKKGLQIFSKALFITPSRIEIDGQMFVEIYNSYMAAYESDTRKLHKQAAEAMNRFFNCVEITQEELSRYFVLEYGFIKVRPTSVNIAEYSRLGARGFTVERNDGNNNP